MSQHSAAAAATAALASLTSTTEGGVADVKNPSDVLSSQIVAARSLGVSATSFANFSQSLACEVRSLVHHVKPETLKSATAELHMLCRLYGTEIRTLALRCILELVTVPCNVNKPLDQTHVSLFKAELASLAAQPSMRTNILLLLQDRALGKIESEKESLSALCTVLDLTLAFRLIFGLACALSPDTAIQVEGTSYLNNQLLEWSKSPNPLVALPPQSLPQHALHQLLYYCRHSKEDLSMVSDLLLPLTKVQDKVPVVMLPMLGKYFADLCGDSLWTFEKDLEKGTKKRNVLSGSATLYAACPTATLMEELGYDCSDSVEKLLQLFRNYSLPQGLSENDVAQIVGMMCRTVNGLQNHEQLHDYTIQFSAASGSAGESPNLTSWNVLSVVNAIREMNPDLNWKSVMRKLDQPDFMIQDSRGLSVLTQCYRYACKEPFPVDIVLFQWMNTEGHLALMRVLADAPVNVQNQLSYNPQRMVNLQENMQPQRSRPLGTPGQTLNPCWGCLDFLETLLDLGSSGETYSAVFQIFEHPLKHHPEVFCLSLSQVKPRSMLMHRDLCAELMPTFLSSHGHPNSPYVLSRLWTAELGRAMIIRGLVAMYERDTTSVSRALAIAQDLKALTPILDSLPYGFAIDLAALASRREYLNLDKWLSDRIEQDREPFLLACVAYIKEKTVASQSQRPDGKQGGGAPQLSPKTQSIFFNCLLSKMQYLQPDMQEELKSLKFGSRFNPEVEEQANAIFQGIYTGKTSLEEAVNLLSCFKQSKDQREQNIFACMVHNLFDEYRFFPKYPDKELRITGILFGSLIQHQLVTHLPLSLALRYILDALRKPPDSKMFKFGLCAVEQFKDRLRDWPQYCKCILTIPHMAESQPELYKYVENQLALHVSSSGAAGSSVQVATGVGIPKPSTPSPEQMISSIGNLGLIQPGTSNPMVAASGPIDDKSAAVRGAASMDPLMSAQAQVIAPDQEVQDKVHFLFNNLSMSNMDSKLKELEDLLQQEHLRWLGRYIVVKRASIEPNFHQLYLELIDRFNSSILHSAVLEFAYINVKALLKRDKVASLQSERGLLKNLGVWLGNITISKEKAVLLKHLDLRALLIDAYERGRLIGIVPFVAKILDCAAKSKIFAPPQVWTMSLMRLLAEIYQVPRLKMNLKFEIELLCTNLGLDIDELQPSNVLQNHMICRGPNPDLHAYPRAGEPGPPLPDEEEIDSAVSSSGASSAIQPASAKPTTAVVADGNAAGQLPAGTASPGDVYLSQIANYIQINPGTVLFEQQPNLKKLVPLAMERAIREIIAPVVERSVTIACITTRELTSKDFAMDPDENRMRKAAHLMVRTLSGSLALVTCKEPLRVSIANHLRSLLQPALTDQSQTQQPLVEQAIQQVCMDNLELACKVIEKAAMEKAVQDTDETLANAYQARKKHRLLASSGSANTQPFYDMHYLSGPYPAALPEALRPRPGGLQNNQFRVYEDFDTVPRHIAAGATAVGGISGKGMGIGGMGDDLYSRGQLSADSTGINNLLLSQGPEMMGPSETISPAQALEKMKLAMQEAADSINALINELQGENVPLFKSLPITHPIVVAVRKAVMLLQQSTSPQETAALFVQATFQGLYNSEPGLLRESYILFLDAVVTLVPRASKDFTAVLVKSDDGTGSRISPELLRHLLALRILDSEYDVHLSQLLEQRPASDKVLEWAPAFLRQNLLEDHMAKVSDFLHTLDALRRVARQRKSRELTQLTEDLQRQLEEERNAEAEPAGLRSTVMALFDEWIRITAESGNQSKATFISKLQQQGVLKGDELPAKFFAICIEMAVASCLPNDNGDHSEGEINLSYQAVDAVAKLVVLLVKYYYSDGAPTAKITLFNTVLSVVGRLLAREYQVKGSLFNQRPYYRLFTIWLHDLLQPDPALDPIQWQILVSFSNTLAMLRPINIAGFAFAWLELVSHKMFMPKLLMSKQQKGWQLFKNLLVELLKFLEPFLRNAELSKPIRVLYKGTLRVLLVLLHDFPEFLCDYHFALCDVIPPSCIQMRNLILSAFPRNMRLPDPFTPNLKVDLLPEINQPPRILSNYTLSLQQRGILQDLDNYLKTRQPVSFVMELPSRLMLSAAEATVCGTQYDVPTINALVLYVGTTAIATLQSKTAQSSSPITHSAPMDIFLQLATNLFPEGRYLFLNAIANQLRFPNNHTHYFSCVLLYLFAEATQEIIQEQITRVLLERLIVNRPHPWGLLITFIELIKNPRYNFWSHSFTRCAPEVERLFESVARSCILPSSKPEAEENVQ